MASEHQHDWQEAPEAYTRYECALCFIPGWKRGDGPVEELPADAIEEMRKIIAYWDANEVYPDDLIEQYMPRLLAAVEHQKQQVAQALEENANLLHAGRIDAESHWKHIHRLEEQNAQARALLEEVGDSNLWDACPFCGCPGTKYYEKMTHAEECVFPRIRAFLAQHKEPSDGE